jgi:hypothetical protein
MGEVMPPYVGSVGERGRRRNERFWGRGRGARWRRRRNRKRRVGFRRRGWGSSERKGGGDESRGDYVRRRGSKIGRGGRRDVRLDDESRKKRPKGLGQFGERSRCRRGSGRLIDEVD